MRQVVLGAMALAFVVHSAAWAGNVLIVTRSNAFVDQRDNDAHLIPLNEDGWTAISFKTSRTGNMVLTYNANCSVRGNGDGKAFLQISVLVDGKTALPFPWLLLCSESPTYISAVRTVEVHLGNTDGWHAVKILGQGIGTTEWGITDSVLSIQK
jgi:hypothetical protein